MEVLRLVIVQGSLRTHPRKASEIKARWSGEVATDLRPPNGDCPLCPLHGGQRKVSLPPNLNIAEVPTPVGSLTTPRCATLILRSPV